MASLVLLLGSYSNLDHFDMLSWSVISATTL